MNKDPSLLASLIKNSWVSKDINIEYYENPYRHLIIDNLFSKALQTKFNWAFGIGDEFNF